MCFLFISFVVSGSLITAFLIFIKLLASEMIEHKPQILLSSNESSLAINMIKKIVNGESL